MAKNQFGRRRAPSDPTSSASGVTDPPSAGIGGDQDDLVPWVYRWEDGQNGVYPPSTEPPLVDRIIAELEKGIVAAVVPLILVKGELGIGKSTLVGVLEREIAAHDQRGRPSDLGLTKILEARDDETAQAFSRRLRHSVGKLPTVGLARNATIEVAARTIEWPATYVEILPYEPGTSFFTSSIRNAAQRAGLDISQLSDLVDLTDDLPSFMSTHFYFERIAEWVGSGAVRHRETPDSVLTVLSHLLEARLGRRAVDALRELAFEGRARATLPSGKPVHVEGIAHEGYFVHDGYRILLLAGSVVDGARPLTDFLRARNSLPALQMLLDHHGRELRVLEAKRLQRQLDAFVGSTQVESDIEYPIYKRAVTARSLEDAGAAGAGEPLREFCLALIREQQVETTTGTPSQMLSELRWYRDLWWDVSDALATLGDPRLRAASIAGYGPHSGYFCHVEAQEIPIGSVDMPVRHDDAKPLLPYEPQAVMIPELWVGRFLVTTELFNLFWNSYDRDRYFEGTGAQWMDDDENLRIGIEQDFDLSSQRCYWKELTEGIAGGKSTDVLKLSRDRALRRTRTTLWESAGEDGRYGSPGSPIVGVNWWEAQAFCVWWQREVLPAAGFGDDMQVRMLTDWEWEALRRLHYDDAPGSAGRRFRSRRVPAHLRAPGRGRRQVSRPLHVGLFPVPLEGGPTDMVGNVWEWTSSAIYGRIVPGDADHPKFGRTDWDHGDHEQERRAMTPERDLTDLKDDLRYRTTRGSSYFAMDEQTAWDPAYRLCDPPYASYVDLGFRIALEPIQGSA